MSFLQHLVSPKLPTVLANRARIDLPGYDLWLYPLDNVHIVPTKLDASRFVEALSKTLQLYPLAAGQLRRNARRWFIELTNPAVPLDIEYKSNTSTATLLSGDWVVQDDLSVFLNHRPVNPCPVDGDAFLLRLKLTIFDHETSLGVSWNHALGDAILMSRFMHTLSQFYQGLPQLYPPPTFEKYHFPAPSASTSDEFWPRLPHLHVTCPLTKFGQLYGDLIQNYTDLKWRMDLQDLDAHRLMLCYRGQKNYGYISKQDCLSAYFIAVLNHNATIPLNTVTNVSSYRNVIAPFLAESMVGNMIQNVPVTVPQDMAGIASAIRHELVRCRNPEYIYKLMSVASDCMLEIADADKALAVILRDDTSVTVDSNLVIDWCSAHFGCPDGAQFYTIGMGKHFLRCFRSNPVKGDDGVWRARPSVDISIGVKTEQKPKILETLARGFQYVLDSERMQS